MFLGKLMSGVVLDGFDVEFKMAPGAANAEIYKVPYNLIFFPTPIF